MLQQDQCNYCELVYLFVTLFYQAFDPGAGRPFSMQTYINEF